jgi:hypothetical protein
VKELSRNITQQTIDFWQPRYPQALTGEDAREIIENTARFFDVLVAWERKSGEESMMGGQDREEKATESVAREETRRQPGEIARLCPDVTHSEAASTGEPKHFRWRTPR